MAAYLTGKYLPPERAEMERIIKEDEAAHRGQYYNSPRHTIQVDFNLYVRDLMKEIERGAKRAKAKGGALPVKAQVGERA